MKGKRYTTEDKIRILREGDRGKSILEVCRAHNISEVSFAFDLLVSASFADLGPAAAGQAAASFERGASALRLPTHRGTLTPGGMERGQAAHPETAPCRRPACAADQAQGRAPRDLHGAAHHGPPSWPRVDVGLYQRCHRARRDVEDAHDPR